MKILIRFAIILLFSAQLVGCYTLVVPSTCKYEEASQQESTLGGGRGGPGSGRR
jgi:hypothetical protein